MGSLHRFTPFRSCAQQSDHHPACPLAPHGQCTQRRVLKFESFSLEQLRAKGLQVTEATTQQITSNLLTVICSHQAATPVVSTAAPA